MKQYLLEQITKGTGQLEDIFMRTIPVECNRGHKSLYAAGLEINYKNEDTTVLGKKRQILPSPVSSMRKSATGVVYVIASWIAV